MGIYTFTGTCYCCKKPFSFHPNKVPSFDGKPLCKDCVEMLNKIRKQKGLSPITYEPDAYKAALDENEDRIDWKE